MYLFVGGLMFVCLWVGRCTFVCAVAFTVAFSFRDCTVTFCSYRGHIGV